MENQKTILILSAMYLIILGLSIFYLNSFAEEDTYAFYMINSISTSVGDAFFPIISWAGSIYLWIAVIIILWLKEKRELSSYLATGMLIAGVSTIILKFLIMRPRPFDVIEPFKLMGSDIGFSFPSAHAVIIFTALILMSYDNKKWIFPMLFVALSVCVARVYMGVHYPIDVIFGALFGIIIGFITINLPVERLQEFVEEKQP